MRKSLMFVVAIATVTSASTAWAGSIDYLSNQSAEFIRSFNRNASIDGADIASFNPAGTVWMEDGLHLMFGNQFIFKEYTATHTFGAGCTDGSEASCETKDFTADNPSVLLPSLHAVFKMGDFAAFGSFTVPAGGGTLIYEDGVPFLESLSFLVDGSGLAAPANGRFEGTAMYLSPTIGAAYKFIDMISISASARAIFASKNFKGEATYNTVTATLDTDKEATGFGAIFGLNVQPITGLFVAVRYEMQTALEWETTRSDMGFDFNPAIDPATTPLWSFVEGAKEDRDLPQVIAAGIGYRPIEQLNLLTSFQYYLTEQADGSDDTYNATTGAREFTVSYHDDYENGWDLAGAVEYNIMPELLVSAGYIYTKIGSGKSTMSDFEYALDSQSVGLGARYDILDNLAVSLGFSGTFYQEQDSEGSLHPLLMLQGRSTKETFKKQVYGSGLSVSWRAL